MFLPFSQKHHVNTRWRPFVTSDDLLRGSLMARRWRGGVGERWARACSSLVHTTSVRRRISLTLHWALAKCIVGPSVLLAPWPESKSLEMFNFSGSDGSVVQSDCVMQIYARILSNEIAFVMQPGRTHGYVKKPPSVNGRM